MVTKMTRTTRGTTRGTTRTTRTMRTTSPRSSENPNPTNSVILGREFLFFVADVPDADYFARCVLDRVITGHVRFAEDVDFAVEGLTFVDIHYRFSLRVQDGPKRPALYAARHIGGYADIIITRL